MNPHQDADNQSELGHQSGHHYHTPVTEQIYDVNYDITRTNPSLYHHSGSHGQPMSIPTASYYGSFTPDIHQQGINQNSNYLTSEMLQGQGSTFQQTPFESPSSPSQSKLTYFTRPELPAEEINARPKRLNVLDWQKKYHETELLTIYGNIADVWGPLPKSTITMKLYKRLNKYLAAHPELIDGSLFGHQKSIAEAAEEGGVKHCKNPPARLGHEPLMDKVDFLAWITRPSTFQYNVHTPVQSWVPSSTSPKQVNIILERLAEIWGNDKNIVEQRLGNITEHDFAPFFSRLAGKNNFQALQAAQELRGVLKERLAILEDLTSSSVADEGNWQHMVEDYQVQHGQSGEFDLNFPADESYDDEI